MGVANRRGRRVDIARQGRNICDTVGLEVTDPKTVGWARTAAISAGQSPPSATAVTHTRTLEIPADVPPAVSERVRELALLAFESVGAEGIARVDTFVTPDGSVLLNEINTMPGFTPISMYPKLWEASGVPYPALIDELVQLALERPTGLR